MYVDEADFQDDVTFKVAYDKGDHGDHVLDDGMYGWGPCAPWQSWCLLEHVGDAPGQAPIQGAFTKWAAAQPPDSAGEAGEGEMACVRWLSAGRVFRGMRRRLCWRQLLV